MQSNKTCPLFEQYLSYLIVIKGRSENTILDYRTDLLMFFRFIIDSRNHNTHKLIGIFWTAHYKHNLSSLRIMEISAKKVSLHSFYVV